MTIEIVICQEVVRKRRAELALKNRKPVVLDTLPEPEPDTFDLGEIE